jgi:purine-binding chemotaxis protein CheW
MQHLIFKTAGQIYAIPTYNMTGIENIHEITPVPGQPEHVRGNVNFEGLVVPIIDFNLRLGKVRQEYNDYACILRFTIEGLQSGFIVEEVHEIVSIYANEIQPPPRNVLIGESNIVIGVARINGDLVLLLDSTALIHGT